MLKPYGTYEKHYSVNISDEYVACHPSPGGMEKEKVWCIQGLSES